VAVAADEVAIGPADVALVVEAKRHRAGLGLVAQPFGHELERDRPAEAHEDLGGVVLVAGDLPGGHADARRGQHRLGADLVEPGPRRGARRCLCDLAQPCRVAQRVAQRLGAGQAGAQPGDGRDAGAGEVPCGVVVEQLGERRSHERRDRTGLRAGADALAHGVPALADGALESRGLVVEHEDLVDPGVLADGGDGVAQGAHLAPDERGVVEWVGHGGGGGQQR
jgi:hypothetical protein